MCKVIMIFKVIIMILSEILGYNIKYFILLYILVGLRIK